MDRSDPSPSHQVTPQRAAALQRVRAGAWLAAHSVIRELDALFCRSYVAVTGEKPVLLVFGFHAVAPRKALSRLDLIVDPAQSVSVESFDLFVTQYRDLGYEFVTPAQVSAGLPVEGRYVMISFDDGYHNNLQVLPVLRKHGVPAVFSISTNHVAEQRSFWWDALYRARSHRGVSPETIFREQTYLKTLTHVGIHDHLFQELGSKALTPLGDDDRPLTVAELQAFARDPLVHLGNHTSDHAVLTNYSADGAAEQIGSAQHALEEWTGVRPIMIAYPNGNFRNPFSRPATARAS